MRTVYLTVRTMEDTTYAVEVEDDYEIPYDDIGQMAHDVLSGPLSDHHKVSEHAVRELTAINVREA